MFDRDFRMYRFSLSPPVQCNVSINYDKLNGAFMGPVWFYLPFALVLRCFL